MTKSINLATYAKAVAYCQDKSTPVGSDFYYTTLYAKEEHKGGVLALITLFEYLQQVLLHIPDHQAAGTTFSWWHSELKNSVLDNGTDHPVFILLRPYLKDSPLLFDLSESLIVSHSGYAGQLTFVDQNDLMNYCADTYGVLFQCLASIYSPTQPVSAEIQKANGHWGALYGLVKIWQQLPLRLNQGHKVIPHQWLGDNLTSRYIELPVPAHQIALTNKHFTTIFSEQAAIATNTQLDPTLHHYRALTLLLAQKLGTHDWSQSIKDISPLRKLWICYRHR